ncbi:MAG TPA: hypothetical protein ENN99_00575 [Chloroflexi bacterium]|nr:hypothetical protein [Chloroflexota bacterium]
MLFDERLGSRAIPGLERFGDDYVVVYRIFDVVEPVQDQIPQSQTGCVKPLHCLGQKLVVGSLVEQLVEPLVAVHQRLYIFACYAFQFLQ